MFLPDKCVKNTCQVSLLDKIILFQFTSDYMCGEWWQWLFEPHGSLFQLNMSGKLPLVLVASLALVSVVAAHSVEKRQTTVSKSECLVSWKYWWWHNNIRICLILNVSTRRKSDGKEWIFKFRSMITSSIHLWLQMIIGYVSVFTNKGLIDWDFYFVQRNSRLNVRRNIMREIIRYEDTSVVAVLGTLP